MSNTSSTVDDVDETQDPSLSSVHLPLETDDASPAASEPNRSKTSQAPGTDLADTPAPKTTGGSDPTSEPDTSPTPDPSTPSTPADTPTTATTPPTTPAPSPTPSPTPSPSDDPTTNEPETTPEPSQPETTPSDPTTTEPPPQTTDDPTEPPGSTEVTTEIVTPTDGGRTSTLVTTITSGTGGGGGGGGGTGTGSPTSGTISPTDTGAADSSNSDSSGAGLQGGAKIAVAVVVPIAAVTLLVLGLLFWWRKRKQRLENQEQRKQELDDYSYTPHADPTIPAIGAQEASGGYRGWGTTMSGSGRNGSTTLSGGFSDATSPTQVTDAPMAGGAGGIMSSSPPVDSEIIGAMGAMGAMGGAAGAAAGDVHRGPSNASSQYSAAGRSDVSDGGIGVAYGSGAAAAPPYYEGYHVGNPYDPANGSPPRPADLLNGQQQAMPVIRDNPARRNPRIESPAHYPQQTGISQNF